MENVTVIEVPTLTVVAAHHGLNAELRKTIGRVRVSLANGIGHHDIVVGQQHHARVVAAKFVQHVQLRPYAAVVLGGRDGEPIVVVDLVLEPLAL